MTPDKKFVAGFFRLIAFLMTGGATLYGVYGHNWWFIAGIWLGAIGTCIGIAVKEATNPQ